MFQQLRSLSFPGKLIPLIIKNILAGQKLPVYGKGDNVRDWLYVEDHAKAIDAVLERGRIGEVYNVGGFNEEQNINIVKLIIGIIARIMREEPEYRRVLKTDVKNINEDLITFVATVRGTTCVMPSIRRRLPVNWAGIPRPPLPWG